MQAQIIRLLNQLNQEFYGVVAQDFVATRQQPWMGWQHLLPSLEKSIHRHQSLRVLDIGCGNGRFAKFLSEKLSHASIEYYGVDSSEQLLEHAKATPTTFPAQFHKIDLIEALLDFNSSDRDALEALSSEYDVICAFGVLHHLPSYDLRKSMVEWSLSHLSSGGTLAMTAWQFTLDKNLVNRQIPQQEMSARLHFPVSELEPNDFFLTWERGNHAVRYCHLVDQAEIDQLLKDNGNPHCATFSADGKEGNLNRYIVIEKQ